MLLLADLKEITKEGILRLPVFMKLPPCIRSAIEEYTKICNGDTEFYLENLVAVSFLIPESSFVPVTDKNVKLIDNPLAVAILILTSEKLDEGEVSIERVRRKVTRKNDSVWNLVRCLNPLLKEKCSEKCSYKA